MRNASGVERASERVLERGIMQEILNPKRSTDRSLQVIQCSEIKRVMRRVRLD